MRDLNAGETASAVVGSIAAAGAVDVIAVVTAQAEQDWQWKLSLQRVEGG